jgi:hypothetical protein
VCSFIGAQAQIDTKKTGGRNPLVDMALSLDILGTRSPEEEELDRMRGPMVARDVSEDSRFAKVAADPDKGVDAENASGSYEAFLSMMGGPPPVPGRE